MLVVLVYLESAKICTGPKIFRILKKLGNTVLNYKLPFLKFDCFPAFSATSLSGAFYSHILKLQS